MQRQFKTHRLTKYLGLCLGFLSLNLTAATETPPSASLTPVQTRAAQMVAQMTLEEKASQLVNQSRAIKRLNIPHYDWWSEALHGVQTMGVTVFPEPIGLAATFNTEAISDMAEKIAIEGRIKHNQFMSKGHSEVFEGIDFWAPNINIFRDPRWGRGQETYGEDPYLSGRMGIAYVQGMQGNDENFYLAIATPKHFAVHSGPESTRHKADVQVSKRDMLDTYLPAFRATVIEGKAASVMCAYNSINGQPACVNEFLLQDQLRTKWKFDGYVVSDCEAVVNIFRDHKFTPTQAAASALAIQRGMDNECIDFGLVNDDHDYKAYIDAVKQGLLNEADIDRALVRLFTARFKLGMFDPTGQSPYKNIDEKRLDSTEHRALALKIANQSMVLLKNDGTLPLKNPAKIAVVGPLADQTPYLFGNYNGTPTYAVSVLEGLKKEFPEAKIEFSPGTQFLRKEGETPPANIFNDGKKNQQLTLNFYSAFIPDEKTKSVSKLSSSKVEMNESLWPKQLKDTYPRQAQWSGFITVPQTGEYSFGMRFRDGYSRIEIEGKPIAQGWGGGLESTPPSAKVGHTHLEAGKKYPIKIAYVQVRKGATFAELFWSKYSPKPMDNLKEIVADAQAVVAVLGITSELEGEEMPVAEEGFSGGDRTSLDLPKPEQELLETLHALGKPVVLVLANGSALSVNWAQKNINAIVESWYPGQEGGNAVAQTLSGKNNPAGRLPVTFYKSTDQLPAFENYAMQGRTYRYFKGEPLYPFGFGLSYTNFSYEKLKVSKRKIKAGDTLTVTVKVKNTGKYAGDEVVQLYLTPPQSPSTPARTLKGFQRISLQVGEEKTVSFTLSERDLSQVTAEAEIKILPGQYSLSVGGGQPLPGTAFAEETFKISGSKTLAE